MKWKNKNKNSGKLINYRSYKREKQSGRVFDLTELKTYPLRQLRISLEESTNKKKLEFYDLCEKTLFADNQRYLIVGEANRTNMCKEYFISDLHELYNAIQKYIANALSNRIEPLDYFLVSISRLYDLRSYKRLLRKQKPVLRIEQ